MIIDADVHISPTFEGGNSITIDELLRRMDAAGVDRALTWLQPSYCRDVAAGNRYVFQAVQQHPDRILGFGWTDPNLGVPEAIAEAKRCIEEFGFYGVKLNGAQNNFYIDDPRLSLPIVDAAAASGRLLAFHIGADAYERTHPFRLAKIAARHPGVQILAVHMGGASFDDLSAAMIEMAEERPNISLIGSAVRAVPILKAIATVGTDRVCFGSDTPFELMHVEVARYYAMLRELPTGDQEKVMGGNLARLLGLPS